MAKLTKGCSGFKLGLIFWPELKRIGFILFFVSCFVLTLRDRSDSKADGLAFCSSSCPQASGGKKKFHRAGKRRETRPRNLQTPPPASHATGHATVTGKRRHAVHARAQLQTKSSTFWTEANDKEPRPERKTTRASSRLGSDTKKGSPGLRRTSRVANVWFFWQNSEELNSGYDMELMWASASCSDTNPLKLREQGTSA